MQRPLVASDTLRLWHPIVVAADQSNDPTSERALPQAGLSGIAGCQPRCLLGSQRLPRLDRTDTLNGLDGNDSFFGMAGTGTIRVGEGTDAMTGGVGADRFVFTARPCAIRDDEEGDDIDLTAPDLSFGQVQAAASETGKNLMLTFGNRSVLIETYSRAMLSEEDFIP